MHLLFLHAPQTAAQACLQWPETAVARTSRGAAATTVLCTVGRNKQSPGATTANTVRHAHGHVLSARDSRGRAAAVLLIVHVPHVPHIPPTHTHPHTLIVARQRQPLGPFFAARSHHRLWAARSDRWGTSCAAESSGQRMGGEHCSNGGCPNGPHRLTSPSHGFKQSVWKICSQGISSAADPGSKSSLHTEHCPHLAAKAAAAPSAQCLPRTGGREARRTQQLRRHIHLRQRLHSRSRSWRRAVLHARALMSWQSAARRGLHCGGGHACTHTRLGSFIISWCMSSSKF